MSISSYKVIELVGTSPNSWEDAVRNVVTHATKSLRDIRIVEVVKLDAKVVDGEIKLFRARVKLSFKFQSEIE